MQAPFRCLELPSSASSTAQQAGGCTSAFISPHLVVASSTEQHDIESVYGSPYLSLKLSPLTDKFLGALNTRYRMTRAHPNTNRAQILNQSCHWSKPFEGSPPTTSGAPAVDFSSLNLYWLAVPPGATTLSLDHCLCWFPCEWESSTATLLPNLHMDLLWLTMLRAGSS